MFEIILKNVMYIGIKYGGVLLWLIKNGSLGFIVFNNFVL